MEIHEGVWEILSLGRFIIMCAFVWSSISKFLNLSAFVVSVRSLSGFSGMGSKWTAALVLLSELWIVIAMISYRDELITLGLGFAIGLLALFSFAMVRGLRRDIVTSCGCFGQGTDVMSWSDVVRNGVFILIATLSLLGQENIAGVEFTGADVVFALGGVAITLILSRIRPIVWAILRPISMG